jgi:pectin methylesterase-like acyl-CoA thioesterase
MKSSTLFLVRNYAVALTILVFATTLKAITTVTVGGTGTGHYATVQEAVNALPSTGGQINVTPATYTEQVVIAKPNVRLIGMGAHASSTVITFDSFAQKSNGSGGTVGDIGSATVQVTSAATSFYFDNIQIQNTYTQEGHTETQALAMSIYADKSVGFNVRLIGRQDTFFAGANGCTSTSCTKPTRVYLHDCYIEGNVDYIFGDAAVVLDTCTMQTDEHGSLSGETTITAQNKRCASCYLSGFVFYNSELTDSPSTGFTNDYLGRPWGVYSTNIYINTNMQAPITPAGWIEFTPGTTDNLPTSFYAEYGSTGPGAIGFTDKTREKYVIYLTSAQVTQYEPDNYLKGSDDWVPTAVD